MNDAYVTREDFRDLRAEMREFRAEMREFRAEMREDFRDLRAEMHADFRDVRGEISKIKFWLLGALFALVLALIANPQL